MIQKLQNDITGKEVTINNAVNKLSYRFSLLCPLGQNRIKIPTKSINCGHFQCFDAINFILINLENPIWKCPICLKPCFYDDLHIESFYQDIVDHPSLSNYSEEIEIYADGAWRRSKGPYIT